MFPRIKTSLPVIVEQNQIQSKTIITDLSAGGAYIQSLSFESQVGDTVRIKYQIPKYGHLEHSGRAIRLDRGGFALFFYHMDRTSKEKLWKYVLDHLANVEICPYCGEPDNRLSPVCRVCGWSLDFQFPTYIEYHERRFLLQRLYARAEHLETEQIRSLLHSFGMDTLGGTASVELGEMVGASPIMLEVFAKIRKIAPTDIPVLILGESGTGKELAARAIHERSNREERPFLPIHCSAIPESILEAELFGYEKGALAGADSSKGGNFEHADGGTLFLDEIGELPLGLQAKLLRVLEDQLVERVGGIQGRKVNVRLISATHRDLQAAITQERFRGDLYYRLGAFTLRLPPVRERGGDKTLLAKYFLKTLSPGAEASKAFTEETLELIAHYHWPGNVREIINKVRRAIIMSHDHWIRPEDLDIEPSADPAPKNVPLRRMREKLEKEKIETVLRLCGNNISKAARMLEVSRPTVYTLKRKYGL